jgi:hypothetical protein
VTVLDIAEAALADGGQVVIGTFAADGPRTCSGLPVANHDPAALAGQFAGFAVLATERENTARRGAPCKPLTWLLLRRA